MHQITVFNNVSEHILSPSAHIDIYLLGLDAYSNIRISFCLQVHTHTHTHTAELQGPAQQCVLELGFPSLSLGLIYMESYDAICRPCWICPRQNFPCHIGCGGSPYV